MLPTKPRTPRNKGKVERGVAYVQDNPLKGRKFASLREQNELLCHWEQTIADQRIHGTTKQQVIAVFNDAEKAGVVGVDARSNAEAFRDAIERAVVAILKDETTGWTATHHRCDEDWTRGPPFQLLETSSVVLATNSLAGVLFCAEPALAFQRTPGERGNLNELQTITCWNGDSAGLYGVYRRDHAGRVSNRHHSGHSSQDL